VFAPATHDAALAAFTPRKEHCICLPHKTLSKQDIITSKIDIRYHIVFLAAQEQ
jgi:hypothetical protein